MAKFCENCGKPVDENQDICLNCGVSINKRGAANKFCENCGKPLKENQDICLNCGCAVNKRGGGSNGSGGPKSKICAGLLAIFLGSLGIHNFYLGYTNKAVAQLLITILTCGCGVPISEIWGIIEGIMIFTGSIDEDADGVPLQ